jgi:regulator of sigma E protease
LSWVLAFAGFAALIILHEFGHFVVAKWTGMRVERFFLFFPPTIASFKRGETEYGIGAIPLGGFVKITGMNPDELEPQADREEIEEEDKTPTGLLNRVESSGQDLSEPLAPDVLERAYYNQPVWKRIVVIAAGPAMNLLIAFVILFGLAFGVEEVTGNGLEVGRVVDDSPAAAVLEENDRIVSVDGQAFEDIDDPGDRAEAIRDQIGTHACAGEQSEGCAASDPVDIVVVRDGVQVPLEISPEYDPGAEQVLLGVGFQSADVGPANFNVPQAAEWAVDRMWFVTTETVSTLAQLFKPEKRDEISGLVGSYETTRQAIDFDTRTAIGVLALISLSLAIINLFPFLPLDGGHIFWSIVEKVRGRRVSFATMEKAGAIGFVLILFLFFIGLSNDIGRLSGDGFGIESQR